MVNNYLIPREEPVSSIYEAQVINTLTYCLESYQTLFCTNEKVEFVSCMFVVHGYINTDF